MANLGRIPTTHEALFPAPVLCMGVTMVEDFDAKREGKPDFQARDKETNERLWAVSVIDPHQPAGHLELKVRIAAPVQPVPPVAGGPCEFDGIEVVPWLDTNRTKPRIAYSLRAAGFRTGKGKAS